MINYRIKKITNLPVAGFFDLKSESEDEGFFFLGRLLDEWQNSTNRFSKNGEGLYGVFDSNNLIAIGGINLDPYFPGNLVGRIRRFYVKKTLRRNHLGKSLLQTILSVSKEHFEVINLFTDNEKASKFYLDSGFELVYDQSKITHRMLEPQIGQISKHRQLK